MAALTSYLLGSIPIALIAARLAGRPDPRTVGTGNAGATNIALSVHPLAGLVVFLADVGKGYLAGAAGLGLGGPELGSVCALAAVVGQVVPVFSGLRGGKGVATTFGGYLGISPALAIAALGLWVLNSLVLVRRFVPATVVTLLLMALLAAIVAGPAVLGYAVAVAIIGILAHRHDLAAWRRGEIPSVRQALRDNRRRT
ncbi:MAG TPA: glycerol-3-phosphate acyltransferase [Candidatus Limnocylindria bacterium]|jgi:glycerol-3-phosphate acyltransferase PlsY